jgi:hypothetical protein
MDIKDEWTITPHQFQQACNVVNDRFTNMDWFFTNHANCRIHFFSLLFYSPYSLSEKKVPVTGQF